MSRFTKFALAASFAVAIAPVAAQARSADQRPAVHSSATIQSGPQGAFVPGRGTQNLRAVADSNQSGVAYAYPDGRPVSING